MIEESKPLKTPVIYVTKNDKIQVGEHDWDGKCTKFAVGMPDSVVMPMVHVREYQYSITKNKQARVLVLCDDRIEPDQLAQVVMDMSPWIYTYGFRITVNNKPKLVKS